MGVRRAVQTGEGRRRFRWPTRRDGDRTVGAFLTAAALTGAAASAISGGVGTLYHLGDAELATRVTPAQETVLFATTVQTPVSRRESRITEPLTRRRALAAPPDGSRTLSAAMGAVDSSHAVPADTSPIAARAPGAAPASTVLLPASRFSRSAPLGRAERDSLLHQLSLAVPSLALTREPTRAEVDSSYRQEALRQWWWRQQGRPVPIPIGSVSLSLPLLSPGPSRAERLRDSMVHADNLLRIARLAERARARSDSSRLATSAPAGAKTPKH